MGYPPDVSSIPSEAAATVREETDLSQGAFSEDGVDLTQIAWSLSLTPEQRLAAAQDVLDGVMELRDGREAAGRLESSGFTRTHPPPREPAMHNEFTAVFERDGDWVIAYCPEIPGANGQGRSKEEARTSLAQAIALILEDRREEGLRGIPAEAELETVEVA